jgi:hypothetical protein
MLALIFLCIAVFFGDILSRRFLSYRSIPHRLAVAFLTGILLSTCFTYPTALLFAGSSQPLLWANLMFVGFVAFASFIVLKFPPRNDEAPIRPTGKWQYDAVFLAAFMILGCWLMFATLDFKEGSFTFAARSWSDFGPNLSLAQSLVVGNNYPTVHPFYPTETVRYHFLFWFLSANLSYLGLNIVWAINVLSILSLLSLLVLIMTFAEVLFNSRAVGRISAAMFFLASSSISYIPFLFSHESVLDSVTSILDRREFLTSGFPYRGDDWGALSVAVFANQRQLLSAVGIVLIVLIYLVEFYRKRGAIKIIPEVDGEPELSAVTSRIDLGPMIFCGLLIGSMPYWNSPVFVAGSLVIGGLFVLFPKRPHLLLMIATVVLIGLPQILLLRSGNVAPSEFSFFNWGYIVSEPTVAKLIEYLLWTFGFKWLLIVLSFFLVPTGHRKLLLALSVPFVVVFSFQLSMDVFNNHKLLNAWAVFTSVYVAYALWTIGRENISRRILAITLAIAMTLGAVIDLAPIHNDGIVRIPHRNDRLSVWITENTAPGDIFLSDRYLSHQILFSGRKIFLGNTLYAWTAGYELAEKEKTHVKMFTTGDINELRRLLAENNITHIAIDDGLRTNNAFKGLNEVLIRNNFPIVFDDTEKAYWNLKIFRVRSSTH